MSSDRLREITLRLAVLTAQKTGIEREMMALQSEKRLILVRKSKKEN